MRDASGDGLLPDSVLRWCRTSQGRRPESIVCLCVTSCLSPSSCEASRIQSWVLCPNDFNPVTSEMPRLQTDNISTLLLPQPG